MPGPTKLIPKPSPIAIAMTAYGIWRKLPPEQRRQIIAATRKHGPRVARSVVSTPRRRWADRKR